tara:strand:+ start:2669 stop:2905 length:237 start_codon:yes stop_codon:yes gene_type:complete
MKIQFKLTDENGNPLNVKDGTNCCYAVIGAESSLNDLVINGVTIVADSQFLPESMLDIDVGAEAEQLPVGNQGELELQ